MYEPTPAQLLLRKLIATPTKHILAYGGARSGKTFEILRSIVAQAAVAGGRYVIFRQYYNAVKTSVLMDTLPTVFRLCFPQVTYVYHRGDSFFEIPATRAEIWGHGLDDPSRVDKILGRQYTAMFFNECSEIAYSVAETAYTRCSLRTTGIRYNKIYYDCNPPLKTHWSHRIFVEKVNPVTRLPLKRPENYAAIKMNPADNAANLPSDFLDQLEALSPEKKKRFLYGEWTDETENALWKPSLIDPYRVATCPQDLAKIVIGVDPAVTTNKHSDLTGIIVAGIRIESDEKTHYYVMEDCSGIYTPQQWTGIVSRLYDKWRANEVVVEVNQGGQLVVEALRNANMNLPIKPVRASSGKLTRAEPSAVLYENGLVHHVGILNELEEELVSYTGTISEKSPDRMDALVWALTRLSEFSSVEKGDFWFM